MVTLLSLAAALSYGVGDFFGGTASRRGRSGTSTLGIAIPVGLLCLLVAALSFPAGMHGSAICWGLLSGLAGGLGLLTFYPALGRGPMSVVAPVSALVTAIVPVAAGLATTDSLSLPDAVGMTLCIAAIVMVSSERGTRTSVRDTVRSAGMAAVSGLGFGVFFLALHLAGGGSGLWPLVSSRFGTLAVTVVAALVVRSRRGRRPAQPWNWRDVTLWIAVGAGAFDALGNICYFAAVHVGALTIAAVVTSLYPGMTVLLARVIHAEHMRLVQRLGLVIAGAGVVLIAVT